MIDVGMAISGLRLLLDAYKLAAEKLGGKRNNDPDPETLQQVLTEVESSAEKGNLNVDQIEEEINRKFQPEQAKKVKDDLAALSLLTNPPSAEDFDYWSMLTQLVQSLRDFARRAQLFRLRGEDDVNGGTRYLKLPKTGEVFVPPVVLPDLLVSRPPEYKKRVVEVVAALRDVDAECPLQLVVFGQLDRYSSMGGVDTRTVGALFSVSAGQEKNWFALHTRQYYFEGGQFLVTAAHMGKLVAALKSDIAEYAHELETEREDAKGLAAEVDATVKSLGKKSDE